MASESFIRIITLITFISGVSVFLCMFIFNIKIMLLQRKYPELAFRDIAWSGDPKYKNIHIFGKIALINIAITLICVFIIKYFK